MPPASLSLERRTHPGAFFDVLGRRAAVFGYEHRGFEAWAYPLKILEDFRLSFSLEGYPLDVPAEDLLAHVSVRPEATVFTYSHAAFRVRQIIFVPIDEPAVVMLLDISTTLPIRITAAFRPRLRLMWPAGLMTPYVSWNESEQAYTLGEESRRFAAVVGSPAARDVSLMPYQEEPRDVPIRFVIDATPEQAAENYIPVVIAGSVQGADEAVATWRRVLSNVRSLHDTAAAHYRALAARTTGIDTPMDRLDTAFAWAKIGIDKGLVTNPMLGTGLVAGFRTSGESERPGFAWFFGRDSLWTALASTSIGDADTTRTALSFLRKFQRDDGKIPHEISQSASLIPWFTDYPYAWASADATPLYVIAHADHWRFTGDREFLQANWPSILKAYRFSLATDKDGDGLIENTGAGHGWVEGGALYPAHEEIYLQGLWVEALGCIAELADVLGHSSVGTEARKALGNVRQTMERTYWVDDRGFYAFATKQPQPKPSVAEPGPQRLRRQLRLDALRSAELVGEDTVLPAVPLWFRTLDDQRAQRQIDRLGSGAIATDWGARLLSAESDLYDPLSYHYGSVWPLFTGWSAMAAYRYGRPHVGYQAILANAFLTFDGALGYVTELLSGDFNVAFGRSSHHQVWSEAMVVTPVLRGLLGLNVSAGGRELRFAPQLPADWDHVAIRNVSAGPSRFDLMLERSCGTHEHHRHAPGAVWIERDTDRAAAPGDRAGVPARCGRSDRNRQRTPSPVQDNSERRHPAGARDGRRFIGADDDCFHLHPGLGRLPGACRAGTWCRQRRPAHPAIDGGEGSPPARTRGTGRAFVLALPPHAAQGRIRCRCDPHTRGWRGRSRGRRFRGAIRSLRAAGGDDSAHCSIILTSRRGSTLVNR